VSAPLAKKKNSSILKLCKLYYIHIKHGAYSRTSNLLTYSRIILLSSFDSLFHLWSPEHCFTSSIAFNYTKENMVFNLPKQSNIWIIKMCCKMFRLRSSISRTVKVRFFITDQFKSLEFPRVMLSNFFNGQKS